MTARTSTATRSTGRPSPSRLRQFIPEEDRSSMLWERDNWHRLVELAPQALNPTLGRSEERNKKKAACSS